MRLFLIVCLGGAFGAGARYLVNTAAARALGVDFPWGTFIANIAGAFLMGLLIEVFALRLQGSIELRSLLATGFLGGFTTFSAYSLETILLFERGETSLAIIYAAGSVLGALLALLCGLTIGRFALS